ncbi:CaiB/BaiF CoA transferase family protein [Novosphingobium sp. BL-52-GroH]|uniref:CaiB/BaiF CoA transferase family protein n=1 Tax=Novosphingobium sp. BL-52-GroH TaxID=3349877 RepID=UPI00384BA08F
MTRPRDAGRTGGALSGLRVVDLGRVLAAPLAAQMLADFGADVVKIERPVSGDEGRSIGSAAIMDANGERTAESSFYLSANRNKRSLEINLADPRGRDIVKSLIEQADVVIENFLPGNMRRFGLDYETVSAVNPGIVYCSLTGYGQNGPYAARPGYDPIFQAQSGLMAVTGIPDDEPGAGPMRVGPSIVDVATGYNAAFAIVTALLERERLSGRGQHIDMTLLDTAMAMQTHVVQDYLITGEQPARRGTAGNGGHPARTYACSDGTIYISAGNNKFYAALCRVLGLPELIDDPRFLKVMQRYHNRKQWDAIAEPVIAQRRTGELLDALNAAGVPAATVSTYADAFSDPQVVHRKIRRIIAHPLAPDGEIAVVANPARLGRTPPAYDLPPPLLGEHSAAILMEWLGLSDIEIAELRGSGVI